MVLSFPFLYGFSVLCMSGSVLSVSCGDWLGAWLGLEINLLGFVPLMVQGEGGQSIESCVKYFVVQALGSGLLLLGGLGGGDEGFLWFCSSYSFGALAFPCFFGLVLKLGVAPLHWWVPSVMGGLSWFSCGVLMTWQKLAPFFLLIVHFSDFFWLFVFLGCFSSLLGGLMGIGQSQVRLMMAYSSISHWGWVMGLVVVSVAGSICYYAFYFFISVCVFYFLACQGSWRLGYLSGVGGAVMVLGFLSLGGMPPMSGFVPKLLGVQLVSGSGFFVMLGFLIVGSLASLYYYLSFLFVYFVGESWGFFSLKSSSFFSGALGVCLSVLSLGVVFYEGLFCFI